jgi:hypothetical protein
MTNKRSARFGAVATLLVAMALVGCQRPASHVTLTSLKDPYFPEHYNIAFTNCAYRVTDSHDLHVAARTRDLTDDLRHGEYGQYLHIHMYWQPRPGKTHANASTTNATLRYVVASHEGIAVYGGTGFVYPRPQRDGQLRVNIESARLVLQSPATTPAARHR